MSIITNNAEIKQNLKLDYATPLTVSTNNVVSKNLSEIILSKDNQTTITQNPDNTVSVGTIQDIGTSSIPIFGELGVNDNIDIK